MQFGKQLDHGQSETRTLEFSRQSAVDLREGPEELLQPLRRDLLQTVDQAGGQARRYGVGTGKPGFETPVGEHTIFARVEMETLVGETHPAHEGAVAAYFDFAHAFTAAHRIGEMVAEMEALIELVTGEPPSTLSSREFRFPD